MLNYRMDRALTTSLVVAATAMLAAACSPGGGSNDASRRTTGSAAGTVSSSGTSEWQSLFDGTTLAGWRGLGRDSVPSAHWVVEGGAIKKLASGKVPVQ